MVDLALTQEQVAIRKLAGELAVDVLRPTAAQADERSELGLDVHDRLVRSGLVGGVSDSHGGQGRLSHLDNVLVAEELAVGDPAQTWAAVCSGWVPSAVDALGGTPPPSSRIGAALLGEGFGREPGQWRTTATSTAMGWSLAGVKDPVVNGGRAQHGLVVARGIDGARAAFLLDRDQLDEACVLRDDAATGTLGLRACATTRLRLDDLELPHDALLATGASVDMAVGGLRLMAAATAVGCGRAAIDYATKYAESRIAFGSRVVDFQSISFLLVDLAMELEVVRLSVWETALAMDAGASPERWSTLLATALARAGDLLPRLTRGCVQVLGGHGFLTDHPVERWYRDAMSLVTHDPAMSATRLLTAS